MRTRMCVFLSAGLLITASLAFLEETHEYRKIKAPTLAFFATGYCPANPPSAKCPGFDQKKVVESIESLPEAERKEAHR